MSTTEDVLEDVSEDVLEGVMGEKPLVNFFLLSQAVCEARQSLSK